MSFDLAFQKVNFDVVDHDGQLWLRSYQIGRALGYDAPDVSIPQLYSRHADEFTHSMTRLITLPTNGGEQETRIFSLRGCHLLAMFARTKVAKEFRKWVLDILDKMNEEKAEAEKKEPKSAAERQREYRARKKLAQSQFSLACGKDEFEVWLNELESCRSMIHNKILELGHKGASLAGNFSDNPFNYGLYAVITKWVAQAVISPHKIQNEKWEDPYAIVRILRILKQTT